MTVLDVAAQSQDRRQRITAPVLVAGGVLGACILLHIRDPHQSGSWGFCPWLILTGTYCPGCGGLRAVNDLTRGDIAAAASSNLLFVTSIPLLLFFWARWSVDRWRGVVRIANSRRAVALYGALSTVAVIFWVVRNLPAAHWLAP